MGPFPQGHGAYQPIVVSNHAKPTFTITVSRLECLSATPCTHCSYSVP